MPDAGRRPKDAVDSCGLYRVIVGDYFEQLEVISVEPKGDFVLFGPEIIFVSAEFFEFIEKDS